MSPTYRGSGLSFGSIGSLDDIIESFRLHAAGGGKDLYGTTKHKRVQPLLRREEDPACGPLIDFIAFRALYPPRPSSSKYLVDAGYPQMSGYLGPYKGERYHLPDFRRGSSPRGLFPLNEEESRVDSLVEEDGSHHVREMEEERDRIANLLISH
ncbi:hypothetical protein VitviT2T_013700 [Vitis vinifera]|uniref:Uncharacterized protein n=1 Tax=Vitis vinifera TaxID=29760 RepID=A0ABY9CIE9_VITVI|nr:hypothetical protein VitviT2T_013700 [Vitis vinifera]